MPIFRLTTLREGQRGPIFYLAAYLSFVASTVVLPALHRRASIAHERYTGKPYVVSWPSEVALIFLALGMVAVATYVWARTRHSRVVWKPPGFRVYNEKNRIKVAGRIEEIVRIETELDGMWRKRYHVVTQRGTFEFSEESVDAGGLLRVVEDAIASRSTD